LADDDCLGLQWTRRGSNAGLTKSLRLTVLAASRSSFRAAKGWILASLHQGAVFPGPSQRSFPPSSLLVLARRWPGRCARRAATRSRWSRRPHPPWWPVYRSHLRCPAGPAW